MGNLISFFKKVADGLRAEGNFGTAHVYRSTLMGANILIFIR